MTPRPDRIAWDTPLGTVEWLRATNQVSINGEPVAGLYAALAAALDWADQNAPAEQSITTPSTVEIEEGPTDWTPTNRSPWAEPIPTNPSYGG